MKFPAPSGNVAWSAAEAMAAAGFSVTSSFVIARLIGPAELGVAAAAVSVHVMLWVVVNALFADALVQRAEVGGLMVSSAFWTSCAAGGAAMAVQAASGWVLRPAMHDPRLVPMCLMLALPLPLVGAAGVRQGMLTRARAYRHLALRTIVGQGTGAVIGVALAFLGCGAWAAVIQQTIASGIGAATLLVGAGWPASRAWRWAPVRLLLSTGLPLTASTIAQLGRYRLFALLIGGTAGPAALGQVHMAFRLVDTVRELAFTALWRLMLPVLSRHQAEPRAMLAEVDRLLRVSSLVMMPLCAVLLLSLGPVVGLILGPRWQAAGEAARPLVGLMVVLALMFPSGVALVAAGKARFTLYANLAGLVASIAAVLLVRPADAWNGVLIWCVSQVFVTPYALWANGRALGVGALRPLRAGATMAAVCAAGVAVTMMLGAVWHTE
jgi:O-antigen/teichoic acid export membrane protein